MEESTHFWLLFKGIFMIHARLWVKFENKTYQKKLTFPTLYKYAIGILRDTKPKTHHSTGCKRQQQQLVNDHHDSQRELELEFWTPTIAIKSASFHKTKNVFFRKVENLRDWKGKKEGT